MKYIFIIFASILLVSCASKNDINVINIKADHLANEFISNEITTLLRNIYAPGKTNLVINIENNNKFIEALENNLRTVGYSIREINHKEAFINDNEYELRFIIDKINDTKEEKRIKRINNDTRITFRVSLIIDKKIYSKLYLLYSNYTIKAVSRWIESDIL